MLKDPNMEKETTTLIFQSGKPWEHKIEIQKRPYIMAEYRLIASVLALEINDLKERIVKLEAKLYPFLDGKD